MAVEPGAIRIVQAKGRTRATGPVALLKSRLLGTRFRAAQSAFKAKASMMPAALNQPRA